MDNKINIFIHISYDPWDKMQLVEFDGFMIFASLVESSCISNIILCIYKSGFFFIEEIYRLYTVKILTKAPTMVVAFTKIRRQQ